MNDTLDATMDREQLVSRNWPDRRSGERRSDVDVDLTIPNRRATDRRVMANTLTLAAFKANQRRFSGAPLSNWGAL